MGSLVAKAPHAWIRHARGTPPGPPFVRGGQIRSTSPPYEGGARGGGFASRSGPRAGQSSSDSATTSTPGTGDQSVEFADVLNDELDSIGLRRRRVRELAPPSPRPAPATSEGEAKAGPGHPTRRRSRGRGRPRLAREAGAAVGPGPASRGAGDFRRRDPQRHLRAWACCRGSPT